METAEDKSTAHYKFRAPISGLFSLRIISELVSIESNRR